VRAAQRYLGPPPLAMDGHDNLARAALLLVSIKAATMIGQPFAKR
jgi:hypothetical protein